jgi:hypothetical protein
LGEHLGGHHPAQGPCVSMSIWMGEMFVGCESGKGRKEEKQRESTTDRCHPFLLHTETARFINQRNATHPRSRQS